MVFKIGFMLRRLTFVTVLSSLAVIGARAHEVSPSIGDLGVSGGELTIELRLNLEAFVAGIDLDGVGDTDETAQSADYDSLRALAPPELEARLRALWPDISADFTLLANGAPLAFDLLGVRAKAIGDVDLPRASFLNLGADLPIGTKTVSFGWDRRFGTLVLRHIGVEDGYTGYLRAGEISAQIPVMGGVAQGGWATFASYIPIGFDHILPKGLDHILFVLGLFFLSTRLRPLLLQITAFTAAHTVTLALGATGVVTLPASIVEPLIAASIAYVAVENLFTSGLSRWRPFVVFGFGLLHGLGFASVLGEIGLPQGQFIPALLGFNLGVEFGQLAVIALVFGAVGYWFGQRPWYRAKISNPASVLIALVGGYWFVERLFL